MSTFQENSNIVEENKSIDSKYSGISSIRISNQMKSEEENSLFVNMNERNDTIIPGSIVLPGSFITSNTQKFLHGHGTLSSTNWNSKSDEMNDDEISSSTLRSTQAGILLQLGSLLTVQSVRRKRYEADVGDVVVGRVVKLNIDSWALDVGASMDALLRLSSVNIPTIQRRKTYADQLQMRNMFQESDLIVAEVLEAKPDRRISLQTRSSKFGKLGRGILVSVDASLMRRQKQHFWIMEGNYKGIRVILSMNGMIWIDRAPTQNLSNRSLSLISENKNPTEFSNEKNPIAERAVYDGIARVRNSLIALQKMFIPILSETILDVLEASKDLDTKEMTDSKNIPIICAKAASRTQI